MIRINLLPHHLRPLKRSPLPHIFSLAVAVLVGVFIVFSFLAQQGAARKANAELAEIDAQLGKLQAVVAEANQLAAVKRSLQGRINTIQGILRDRIIWSRQLHNLARLTPENIWYSRIHETTKTFPEETVKIDTQTNQPVRDPKTGNFVMEKRQVKRPVLEVAGYVIKDTEGNATIAPLTEVTTAGSNTPDALREPAEEFANMFGLYSPELEDTEFNGYRVRGFNLEYVIEPEAEPDA